MTPYHVARSKLFVRERSKAALIQLDTAEIEANIEHTDFQFPRTSSTHQLMIFLVCCVQQI